MKKAAAMIAVLVGLSVSFTVTLPNHEKYEVQFKVDKANAPV